MSTKSAAQGANSAVKGGGVALPPSAEKIQAKFDLAITLILDSWTALTIAVQNSWGGPDAHEKREWLAGAISELLTSEPEADVDYLEEFLVQAINDNFDVHFDDGSPAEAAGEMLRLRTTCGRGDFGEVDEMYRKWVERQKGPKEKIRVQIVESEDEETDGMSEDENVEEDMEMEEAPELVRTTREKVAPKIDEDGFVEVVGKKRR